LKEKITKEKTMSDGWFDWKLDDQLNVVEMNESCEH
jgi:hypothetical protein